MSSRIQRGYNLVEIAIVLTVALMMASWLATSYYQLQKDQRVKETKRTIETIKDAIADYADTHRSQSFLIANSLLPPAEQIYWRVPAGRPYLPCPDITGDGLEDRQPSAYTSVSVTVAFSYWNVRPYTSECYGYKGFVPWRTLNTPPADAWGNFYTYRVDPDFAYSLLGFDQETESASSTPIGDWRVNLPPFFVTMAASGQNYISSNSTATFPISNVNIAVLSTVWDGISRVRSEYDPSLICTQAPCWYQSSPTVVLYGDIASSATRVATGSVASQRVYIDYNSSEIIEGLPVVVLSHGQNGHGAVPSQQPAGVPIHCNSVPLENLGETQNAMHYLASTNCSAVTLSVGSRLNGFVAATPRPSGSPGGEFDDIVGWMTADELKTKLTERGVFPVEKLPPLGLENY